MVRVTGTTIELTRGDTLNIQVAMKRGNTPYTPTGEDSVRFAMRPAGLDVRGAEFRKPVCINKKIPIATMVLTLDPADTKGLDFGDYVYDIEITFEDGTVDTFIQMADFKLLPEVE